MTTVVPSTAFMLTAVRITITSSFTVPSFGCFVLVNGLPQSGSNIAVNAGSVACDLAASLMPGTYTVSVGINSTMRHSATTNLVISGILIPFFCLTVES